MVRRCLVAMFLFFAFSACEEDEVIPRTNPRFSMAMVQLVDERGVEFAANVLDYGSDEILEYGFVFGRGTNLSISSSDFASELGQPSSEFKLKATYAMSVGERLYVAAFMKTATGVVYSLPIPFTSQGSEGFVFERIEAPSEVYFGDTLRVFASKLSKVPTNYSATIQRKAAQIGKITETYFDLLIPGNLEFQEGGGLTQLFGIELTVAGKVLEIEKALTFKAPQIQTGSSVELSYTDSLLIKGEYLYDEGLKIRYTDQENKTVDLEIQNSGEKEIKVKLNAYFSELNPQLELVIRGNSYRFDGLLKLKKTELLPGQKTTFNERSGSFVLKGQNFNPFGVQFNKLEFLPDFLRYQVHAVSPTEMEISFEYNGDKSGHRMSELYLKNGGMRTTNSFQIEWTAPAIPIVLLDEAYFDLEGRTVSLGQKGYSVSTKGIIEVDPAARTYRKVADFSFPGDNPARLFAVPAEGKVYFGTTYGFQDSEEKFFYVFDPISNKVTQLPSIPSEDNSLHSVVYYQGKLYYQGDNIDRTTGADGNILRYSYDIAKNKWEKLPDLYEPDGYFNRYSTFEWKNEIYSISLVAFDNTTRFGTGIFKFNKGEYKWELIQFLEGANVNTDATQSIVVGDKAYIRTLYDFFELDLDTWILSRPGYLNDNYSFVSQNGGFSVGEKFYFFALFRILEFDPIYFH